MPHEELTAPVPVLTFPRQTLVSLLVFAVVLFNGAIGYAASYPTVAARTRLDDSAGVFASTSDSGTVTLPNSSRAS